MDLKKLQEPLPIESIDFRIQSINKGGYATILAYKDARVDMNILDNVVGPENWQRDHKEIHGVVYCGIGINTEDFTSSNNERYQKWVWKWDAGSESLTEKQKGEASDSFKRAGFNWGIGRELYDYPIISIKLEKGVEWDLVNDRPKQLYGLNLRNWKWFSQFTDNKLTYLACKDEKGSLRFSYGKYEKNG